MSKHVLGIGGVFWRAKDPAALAAWYQTHFGITPPGEGAPWSQEAGFTVFAPFEADTEYFGGDQGHMINFRIAGLDAFCADLAAAGIDEVKDRETMEGIGDFAWVQDPEGNRIELWEPTT